jgi:hypothetical protein
MGSLPGAWTGAFHRVCGDAVGRSAPLDDLVDAPFDWKEGWHYLLPTTRAAGSDLPD